MSTLIELAALSLNAEFYGGMQSFLRHLSWFLLGLAKLTSTRKSSMADGMYSGTSSSEDEMPGEDNMWNPLLCTAYHYYNGVRMAQFMNYCSKANISQTCHFAVFLNPVERESMDWFFHIMQEPNERDNVAPTACSSEEGLNDGDSSAAEESP